MTDFINSQSKAEQQRQLVEEMGRNFSKTGRQALPGRILGLLFFTDKEEYTFEEIVEELKISKSSASTAINALEITDKIEYVTYPGDRKRYFRIKVNSREQYLSSMKKQMQSIERLFSTALELKTDKNSRVASVMKEMLKGLEYFKTIIDDYEQKMLKQEI